MKSSIDIIRDTLMEYLDCNEEEAELLALRIIDNLDKNSLIITTSF